MIFKSYILEESFKTIDNLKIFIFYGENHGLKKEFKEKLKIKYKNCEILNIFQDEIIKNKNILINEITNKSLFEKEKIIFLSQVTDKIIQNLEEIIDNIKDEKLFIFSEVLDKKSKLRNYFEKSKSCGITACYQDNAITIKKIITNKLKGFRGLTTQVINLIIQNTGLDRNKVNNEIEKIISLFQDKVINFEEIDLLLNIKTSDDFNLLRDEAISGNKTSTNRLLADTIFESENNIYYLNSINQRINKLQEIEKSKNDSNIEYLVSNLKPPVFWKDKPALIEQAKKWNKKKIHIALKKTFETESAIKSSSSARNDLLIKNLIIEICSTANSV
jgi:DNA polymerase-3 subunit delta